MKKADMVKVNLDEFRGSLDDFIVYYASNRNQYYAWLVDGKLHREDGPAVISETDGAHAWLVDGKLHRADGPAVVGSDGSQAWYLNGKLHREDGPAVIEANGSEAWFVNGVQHRVDGPALISTAEIAQEWWVNGKLHREDGPAVIIGNRDAADGGIDSDDGFCHFFVNGIDITDLVAGWMDENGFSLPFDPATCAAFKAKFNPQNV